MTITVPREPEHIDVHDSPRNPDAAGAQPLSPAQERLWFLHRFDPDDASYNVHSVYRLRGPLDPDAVAAAFTAVAGRHEVLRTRFPGHDGRPVAVVDPPADVPVERLDLTGLDPGEREAAARRLVAERTNAALDLAAASPWRVTLLKLADDDQVLCTVLHHVISDGWSLRVLNHELAALYAAHTSGAPPDLPPPRVQYGDVVRWRQRRPPSGDDLAYWRSELADAPVLELPTDHPRPALRRSDGDAVVFGLDQPLTDAVERLARRARCTPFTVLLAAWQVLLARHTRQTDIVVGVPVAGRDHAALEPLIGLFSTVLALRGDLAGDPTFTELLERTRRRLLLGMAHQEVPFEHLLTELEVGRELSRTPLLETMLTLLPGSMGYAEAPPVPGVEAALFPHGYHPARFDLTLDLWPEAGGDGLEAVLTYSTSLLERATAERLAERFQVLLAAAVASPGERLSRLALLPHEEREQLLGAWNDTGAPVPDGTVVDLVARQADATPDAVAVVCDTTRLTYAELVAAAARLAGRLRGAGAAPGALVAVCLERSADLPVALLGVAMTGAAYVPVDPDHPPARIAYVLEDSGATVAVTHQRLCHLLPDGVTALALDDPALAADAVAVRPGAGTVPHAAWPGPEDTAYVLYTSGSTGRPKGVVVPHRALANLLESMRALVDAAPEHVWLGLTTLSFDIAALELLLPLVTGGTVAVAPPDAARDGRALARLARDHGITHVQATPSVWRMLLDGDLDTEGLVALAGGEALPLPLARELRARTRRLVNVYGPTETTIWSTAWEVPPSPDSVSIGGPIANTTIRVLDPHDGLAPVGVLGELCIGGAGVATGYHRRPALTAERFTPDPYGPPGSRLYRTGDRARWRPDGTCEFLGRTDDQVKLRGFRIELGELEAVLETHPDIQQAAATVHDDALTAYVVGDPDRARPHAAGILPSYMVPSGVVALDALPLTPNGKVDRRALPAPDRPATGGGRAPTTPTERLVAETFAQVIGLDQVAADDDFFALGGHSLLATILTARLSDVLGAPVPVRDLFFHPTVAGLAATIDAAVATQRPGGGAPLRPRPDGTEPPLSAGQERLWFLHRLNPDDPSYNMWLVYRLRGPLVPDVLVRALGAVVDRHESLRARFTERDGHPVQVTAPPAGLDVERIDLSGVPAAEREDRARALVSERTNRPFDLTAGTVRASLLRLDADDHVLCVVQHHITGDGQSLGVIQRELRTLYEAFGNGEASPLPPLPLQYGDVVWWRQVRHDAGADADVLAYWREQLAGAPVLELPTDRPRRMARAATGGSFWFTVPAEVTRRLERLARDKRCSVFMVLLAAYQTLLARHTGQDDVCVGTPTSGRDRPELAPLIGYFVNTLVLRGDLSGDPTFTELLGRTRRTLLGGLVHQSIPFEQLMNELDVGRDLSRSPLFQTMLALHNEAGAGTDVLPGVEAEFFEDGFAYAKFELMLEMWHEAKGISALLWYDADLYDRTTMTRLSDRFVTLLEAVAADPDVRLSRLELLTAGDRAWLREVGGAASAGTQAETALRLFEAQAARTPDAVAVVCGDEAVTYGDLDERAVRLAARLRRDGVGPGSVVGVCLDRSVELVVAPLAVWRAGGAYLPLDPEYPAERLAHLVRDSAAAVVVTRPELAGKLPATVGLLRVDDPGASAPADGPLPGAEASGAAYVIYTSGTTGQPKGVVVEHRSLAARVRWMREEYGLGPGDRVAQFASLSFDTHAEEIYPALAAGATVLLLPHGAATLPDVLATPAGQQVTVLDLPTAYWHHLVDMLAEVRLPRRLRLVVIGGEQVNPTAVAGWRAWVGDRVRLLNTYGPTEATVIATTADLTGPAADGAAGDVAAPRPPIGRPVGGTHVAVVDEHGEPVPPGAPGELAIGGVGVARGYLGQAALTAERFVPDPSDPSGPPGARRYRTGDRVRWRANGMLEFLGRLDDQVKVRGFRIEPGEVEAWLLTHASVGQAAVVVHAGTLVAYVVGAAAAEELRRHLSEALPPYAVPAAFVDLDRLPLTVTGKLDRDALPAPAAPQPAAFVAPRTDAEEMVASVWAEVLGVAQVGALDDFFSLGGHSLLALRVTARLRGLVEVDVPIRTLFTHRTVADLAVAVEELLVAALAEVPEEEAVRLADAAVAAVGRAGAGDREVVE